MSTMTNGIMLTAKVALYIASLQLWLVWKQSAAKMVAIGIHDHLLIC